MSLAIDPLEAFWVTILAIAFGVTLMGLIDARDNSKAIKLLNGHARELAAAGTIRREALRLVVQALLFSVAVPGLFEDRPVHLSWPLVALMLVPVVLLHATVMDARDRRRMTAITAAELVIERDDSVKRLMRAIEENTAISQAASDNAEKAYHEANTVNEKIAHQGERIDILGADQAERASVADKMAGTVEGTAEEVHDIHKATVEGAS